MAQPAAPVAIPIRIDRYANEEPMPVEVPEPVVVTVVTEAVVVTVTMVTVVTPPNRTDHVSCGFAEVGLNGR
jgi:hypothetical protein